MATNTMDNDVDPSATGETKDSDLASENASLRERLMRALAESENTRRQGERRAGRAAIRDHELCPRVVAGRRQFAA
jgi:molecular chaperone GrpE (heat shock protein)